MRQTFVDYYAALGVAPAATAEEIKGAYRRLAVQHHPDRHGDPEKFKLINDAYEVLGDPEKRKAHDLKKSNLLVESLSESANLVVDEYFQQFARN